MIVMQAMSGSPILGFMQVTQHILNVTCKMNFSGVKINQSFNNFLRKMTSHFELLISKLL